jgi:hypothetical protein
MLPAKIAVQVSCHGVTSEQAFRFRAWLGRSAKRRGRVMGLKGKNASRGQRVLDGLSGACARDGGEPEASDTVSFEICIWFNAVLIP